MWFLCTVITIINIVKMKNTPKDRQTSSNRIVTCLLDNLALCPAEVFVILLYTRGSNWYSKLVNHTSFHLCRHTADKLKLTLQVHGALLFCSQMHHQRVAEDLASVIINLVILHTFVIPAKYRAFDMRVIITNM